MWTVTGDGSIVDRTGKVIFFSTDRFVRDICIGNCCFICGAAPDTKPFNNEHVLPEWLLRRYDLFSKSVKLPNGNELRYDRYTVPCCAECNSLMGEVIERPISEVVQGGGEAINDFIVNGGLLNFFVWMGLIFLKTHLKDRAMRWHLDARKGAESIADDYHWALLHHIHSVVRCFYNGCTVEAEAVGSFLSLPVKPQATPERFDFGDLYMAQTMFLRLDDVGLLAVFDDSNGAFSYFSQKLDKITGCLSEIQLREVMVELAWLNLHLSERPIFQSDIDTWHETYRIIARRPALNLEPLDLKLRGALLCEVTKRARPFLKSGTLTDQELAEAIQEGRLSFLWDDDGKFIGSDWVVIKG